MTGTYINPIAHGNSGNLYATAREQGFRFKIVVYFDTGYAFIFDVKKQKEVSSASAPKIYEKLKAGLAELDFELKTKQKGFLKVKVHPRNIRKYLKERYDFDVPESSKYYSHENSEDK